MYSLLRVSPYVPSLCCKQLLLQNDSLRKYTTASSHSVQLIRFRNILLLVLIFSVGKPIKNVATFDIFKIRLLDQTEYIVRNIKYPLKDVNVGFTNIPLKALSDQEWIICQYFKFQNCLFLVVVSPQFWLAHFYSRKTYGDYLNFIFLNLVNRQYLYHYSSDIGLKGAVVNWELSSLIESHLKSQI